jgi:biotin carboxyl carrier protein
MLQININNTTFVLETKSNTVLINGKPANADVAKLGLNKYHILFNNASYTIELLEKDETGKSLKIMVNGVKQTVKIKDKYDNLLQQLGMDKLIAKKNNLVKSPMPGLVLRIMAEPGMPIKKGDGLLVLEAMKMENIIKAEADGIVKRINVSEKQAVEKNAILLELE